VALKINFNSVLHPWSRIKGTKRDKRDAWLQG